MNAIQQRLLAQQKQSADGGGAAPLAQPVPPQVGGAPSVELTAADRETLERIRTQSPKTQLSPNSHNVLLKQLLATNKLQAAAQAGGGGGPPVPADGARPPSRSVSETTEVCSLIVNNYIVCFKPVPIVNLP